MDRLQTMFVFVAVAEEAGFAAAARRLNMSAPSVTRAVSKLEERLGARLLHRTTRSVSLTEAGQRYVADCKRILADIDEANQQAAGIHAAPRGGVHVSASVLFGRVIMTPILLDLLDHYPELEISTLFVDRRVHMVDEGVDVSVRIGHLQDSSLMAIQVGKVRPVICGHPDYFKAHGCPKTPDDLLDHKIIEFISVSPTHDWPFTKDGKDFSTRINSRLRVSNAGAALDAAAAARGITRVVSYMIEPYLKAGELELVLEDYEPPMVPVHVLHKEAGQTSARVRAVVDFLVERLRASDAIYKNEFLA